MEKPSITPPYRVWSALWSVRQKLGKNRRSCYIFPVGQIGGKSWRLEEREPQFGSLRRLIWSGRVDRKREENLI
jgi:hypothetical protein